MTGKERVNRILAGEEVDRSAFWVGNPTPEALDLYCGAFGLGDWQDFSEFVGNDLTWIMPDLLGCYRHPEGKPAFDYYGGKPKTSLNQDGVFAFAESVREIEEYPYFPKAEYLDLDPLEPIFERARKAGAAVFSGMWSCIWHNMLDYFGMENAFIQMYSKPEVVEAVVDRVTNYYLEANELVYDRFGSEIDVFFFGNDMGSQLDCLISPEMYRKFIFPYYRKLIAQAKGRGLKVALHSCGAIDRIIPDIIDMGVDILHPIQAKAANMDAESLQKKYGGSITFMGGVDTQDVLPFHSEQEIRAEVLRIRKIFGNRFICSPSHEALLENVSPSKVLALSESARMILKK